MKDVLEPSVWAGLHASDAGNAERSLGHNKTRQRYTLRVGLPSHLEDKKQLDLSLFCRHKWCFAVPSDVGIGLLGVWLGLSAVIRSGTV